MKIKQTKGITLIALVITIIILLILAGVTINTLYGNNGIIRDISTKEQKKISKLLNKIRVQQYKQKRKTYIGIKLRKTECIF